MQKFIAWGNLELFERKLAEAKNQQELDVLTVLIEEERKHVRGVQRRDRPRPLEFECSLLSHRNECCCPW